MTARVTRSRAWLALAPLALALPALAQTPPEGPTAPTPPGTQTSPEEDASKVEEVDAIYLALPPAERAKAKDAAAKLAPRIKNTSPEAAAQIGCWLKKLGQDDVDDRLIRWTRVCPVRTRGALKGAHACHYTAVNGEDLEASLTKLEEVDEVSKTLPFLAHLLPEVLELQTRYPAAADDAKVSERLGNLAADVQLANESLANPGDKAPRRYRVLAEWLAAKKSDPKSLYSPCN
jgi:hypothetical protein